MRLANGQLLLGPTDLGVHLECRHATALALAHARGAGPAPHRGGEYEELIRHKGDLHERRYLDGLVAAGRHVVEITLPIGDFAAAARATGQAMRDAAEVIYQATFASGGWHGRADFLERVPAETSLGDWGYEAVDTKLARNEALPHHALQLGVYSQWIAQAQGVAPEHMHVQLGSGRRETIRVADVAAYVRRAQSMLRRAVDEGEATEAYPCSHCAVCGFRSQCEAAWTASDHLSRVAGIRRDQVARLRAAGVEDVATLALGEGGAEVGDLAAGVVDGLRWQARLQVEGRSNETLPWERRPVEPARGFARLPAPDPGDVFLDLEGDPFWDPASDLWFLFGLVLMEGDEWCYRTIWGHDPEGEARAFEELVDLLTARRVAHPGMHVYHYSPAEPSALRRLAAQPSSREAEVDDLLRAEAFVDLYAVVRQAIVIGAESYGLKAVEKLVGFVRSADVGSGADAVVAYERWRASGDPALLDTIASYNDEDCRATLALRDWLVEQRPPDLDWWQHETGSGPSEETKALRAERLALRDLLVDTGVPAKALAGELMEYHRREQRPGWWRWFRRLEMPMDDLIRDSEAIGGLTPTAREAWPVRRSVARELTFPPQEHKIHADAIVADPATAKSVAIEAYDDEAGTIVISRSTARDGEPLPAALVPGTPLDMRPHQAALHRLALNVHAGDGTYAALVDLLARNHCAIGGRIPGTPIQTTDIDEQITLARNLADSTLVVQGPPGTGKTWLGGRMIAALLADGARVGVCAVSHKAINNLLGEIEAAAAESAVVIHGRRKTSTSSDSHAPDDWCIENTDDNTACEDPDLNLVAGTSWLFTRPGMDQAFDYLVVDEAGQMSLGDALSVGTAARNLILLGDPMQLPHVSQAIHVAGTGASVLEHVLDGWSTIGTHQGLFLETTRRMHPDVCEFISREIYDGRLGSHPDCGRQGTGAGTGIRYLPVDHTGNSSSSREERAAIAAEIAQLIGVDYTDTAGRTRPLTAGDIMVVAPYNAHVRLLRAGLPAGVRVGTVDKFQGQEAPVVFFSMATSTGEDMPREVGFLFSRNRLNVAISRARCLAYLVCSPALLDARARTVDDMRLISTLCALVEEAERHRARSLG